MDMEIDYYAGCHRLHRRLSPAPMELGSTDEVLARLQGLRVNRISAPHCCFSQEGLRHMMEGVRTDTMVHVCTGCYQQAQRNRPQHKETKIVMLPDLVAMAYEQDRRE